LLLTAVFRADAAGTILFVTMLEEQPDEYYLVRYPVSVYGIDEAIPPSEVDYGFVYLDVLPLA
jgi:hypothetical protein